ncbi:MAG: transporter substrate-binding domain-containing protein [Parachlamydiaceae bacterium]|nr:transporter substrate-binding domain-containing protein [Parachlamydiaceae bacterium]
MNIIRFSLLAIICAFCVNTVNAFDTLEPGILKVAVTDIPSEGENAPGWTLAFLREFEQAYDVKVQFVVVPFDNSWLLPANHEVDVAATGISVVGERENIGTTFSTPYLQVKRGLRIHGDNTHLFQTINDFIGFQVGTVEGMTAYTDLVNRAPQGVNIVVYDSWNSMYEAFHNRKIQAVAEGYYVSVNTDINHSDENYPMIDDHDLIPGQPENLAFAVRNDSVGLLEAINDLLYKTGFPINSEWKLN